VDLAAEGIPVRLTCGVLGFSTQAFYKWRKQPVLARDLDDAYLINALVDAHGDDPAFGYRFLADELDTGRHRASVSDGCGDCAREQRLWSTTTRKGRRGKKPGPAVHDDHVNRDFTADAAEPQVGHRHHRAPHRRRQALLLRDQGPVLQPDRRLRDLRPDDRHLAVGALARGDRQAPARRRR
jgi:hypothetical protein